MTFFFFHIFSETLLIYIIYALVCMFLILLLFPCLLTLTSLCNSDICLLAFFDSQEFGTSSIK